MRILKFLVALGIVFGLSTSSFASLMMTREEQDILFRDGTQKIFWIGNGSEGLKIGDDIPLRFGDDGDVYLKYNTTSGEFELSGATVNLGGSSLDNVSSLSFDGSGIISTLSGNLTLSPASEEVEWTSVWQEQRAHITQFYKPGVNYPGEGEIGVTPVLLFSAANDEWVYYEWAVPDNYDIGSDFKIRFTWAPTDTSTGDVVWAIEYTIVTPNDNETLTTATTTKTVTDSAEGIADELLRTDFIIIPGTGVQPKDTISMRVYRDADADDYGADAALVHLGLYFQIDRNGVASLY